VIWLFEQLTFMLRFAAQAIYTGDSSHQMMLNGDNLNPGSIAQNFASTGYPLIESILISPIPKQDSLYEMFHISIENSTGLYTEYLYHSTINMNKNGGKGEVLAKNQILIQDTIRPELEAIKHGNGEDWWIIIPETNSNNFYRFLLTKDSISGPYHQKIGPNITGSPILLYKNRFRASISG